MLAKTSIVWKIHENPHPLVASTPISPQGSFAAVLVEAAATASRSHSSWKRPGAPRVLETAGYLTAGGHYPGWWMLVSWGPRKLVWKLVVSCGLEMRRRGDLIQRWLLPVESVSWVIETGASSCRPMIHSWNHYLHLPHNSVGVMILDHFEDAGFPWLPFSAKDNDLTKNRFCPVAKNRVRAKYTK